MKIAFDTFFVLKTHPIWFIQNHSMEFFKFDFAKTLRYIIMAIFEPRKLL